MWQPTWPSSGNTTAWGIRGKKLATRSIMKRNKISFITLIPFLLIKHCVVNFLPLFFYIHCSVHHCNCLKITNTMSLVDYHFIFMGSRHSLSTCFELSGSSSSGDHFPVQSASGIVCNLCCSPPVLLRVLLPTVGSRTRRRTGGLQQRLHTIPEADCTGKWSLDDELPESSKHVESEWWLPMKIKG